MKWPAELFLIRHAESAYNQLKQTKAADPEYRHFQELFDLDPTQPEVRLQAVQLGKRFALGCSDRETPLSAAGMAQAATTGKGMCADDVMPPDVIFVSPFLRTEETLRLMKGQWPALEKSIVYREERIRERNHGLSLLYNDWRIYQVMYPEQNELRKLLGDYDYRFLNGENILDVRQGNLSWLTTLTREFAGKRVMAITHQLTILATRANFERLSPAEFLHLDRHDKPANCGVTRYVADTLAGTRGKLRLQEYNKRYYD